MFEPIQKAITEQRYEDAVNEGESMLKRIREEGARQQCQTLLAQAHIGLARRSREFVAYPEAERQYTMAMKVDPQSPVALLELADMIQGSPARKKTAIELYEKGIVLVKQHPEGIDATRLLDCHFKLGQLYAGEKRFREAADSLLLVAREDKNSRFPQAVDYAVDAYSKLPSTLKGKDLAQIIDNLNSVIQIKPREERAYLLLGRIYFDQKDWTQARDRFTTAIELTAGTPPSLAVQEGMYYLALSHRRLGDKDKAAQTLQNLLAMQHAGNYEALCELGEIRMEQAAYAEASLLFDQAIALDKDKYRAQVGKGSALAKKGQYEEARDNYNEVIKHDAQNLPAQMAIARSYADEEKWDDAARESEKVIELINEKYGENKDKDKDKGKDTAAANDQSTSGTAKTASALKDPSKLSDEDRQFLAEAWGLTGKANKQLGKTNLARENFQDALKYVANYAPALDGIGQTFQADGQHTQAQEYFQKAINADPQNPDYYLSMALNWHKYRKSADKALPLYLKYLALGGKEPKVQGWIKECGGTPPSKS